MRTSSRPVKFPRLGLLWLLTLLGWPSAAPRDEEAELLADQSDARTLRAIKMPTAVTRMEAQAELDATRSASREENFNRNLARVKKRAESPDIANVLRCYDRLKLAEIALATLASEYNYNRHNIPSFIRTPHVANSFKQKRGRPARTFAGALLCRPARIRADGNRNLKGRPDAWRLRALMAPSLSESALKVQNPFRSLAYLFPKPVCRATPELREYARRLAPVIYLAIALEFPDDDTHSREEVLKMLLDTIRRAA